METPIFICTEPGQENINTSGFPLVDNWTQMEETLTCLAMEEHSYKTLVVDSLDWFEPIVWDEVCVDTKAKRIDEVGGGFGKGFMVAQEKWKLYFKYLEYLRKQKNMTILQIAHSKIKEVKPPDSDMYEMFTMKLQDGKNASAAALLFEYSDIILFANYGVNIMKETINNDKNKTRSRAIGTGARYLYTEERPAYKAGNRFNLPAKIEFDKEGKCWAEIKKYIPYFNQG